MKTHTHTDNLTRFTHLKFIILIFAVWGSGWELQGATQDVWVAEDIGILDDGDQEGHLSDGRWEGSADQENRETEEKGGFT